MPKILGPLNSGEQTARAATTSWVQDELLLYAPIVDAHLTGTPTAPDPGVSSMDQSLATTNWVSTHLLKVGTLDNAFQVGTTIESWYTGAVSASPTPTTLALTANRFYAVPFLSPRDLVADRIAIAVTTLKAGNIRIGIYRAIDAKAGNLYPGDLIYDSGAISTGTTGVKSVTISIPLDRDELYWLAVLPSVNPTVSSFSTAGYVTSVFGYANTLTGAARSTLYIARTYGALPATYPVGATLNTTTYPGIFLRFSS